MEQTVSTRTGSVGVIGLGEFGRPMARRLAAGGYDILGYDIFARARELAAADGIPSAYSIGELAARCDRIVLSLPSSKDVDQTCFGDGGLAAHAAPGTLIIDTTSGQPNKTREIARKLEGMGIEFVDAGVSGTGGSQAVEAGLLVMVGASPELFEKAKPLLETFGRRIFHLGPVGSGHVAKTLNNMLSGAAMLATAEAVATGIKSGIDPAVLVEVFQASSGRNYWTEYRFPQFILRGDYSSRSGGRLALLEKDLAQAVELGRETGVPMCAAGNAHQMLRLLAAELGPDALTTHAVRRFEEWAQIRFAAETASASASASKSE